MMKDEWLHVVRKPGKKPYLAKTTTKAVLKRHGRLKRSTRFKPKVKARGRIRYKSKKRKKEYRDDDESYGPPSFVSFPSDLGHDFWNPFKKKK